MYRHMRALLLLHSHPSPQSVHSFSFAPLQNIISAAGRVYYEIIITFSLIFSTCLISPPATPQPVLPWCFFGFLFHGRSWYYLLFRYFIIFQVLFDYWEFLGSLYASRHYLFIFDIISYMASHYRAQAQHISLCSIVLNWHISFDDFSCRASACQALPPPCLSSFYKFHMSELYWLYFHWWVAGFHFHYYILIWYYSYCHYFIT